MGRDPLTEWERSLHPSPQVAAARAARRSAEAITRQLARRAVTRRILSLFRKAGTR